MLSVKDLTDVGLVEAEHLVHVLHRVQESGMTYERKRELVEKWALGRIPVLPEWVTSRAALTAEEEGI